MFFSWDLPLVHFVPNLLCFVMGWWRSRKNHWNILEHIQILNIYERLFARYTLSHTHMYIRLLCCRHEHGKLVFMFDPSKPRWPIVFHLRGYQEPPLHGKIDKLMMWWRSKSKELDWWVHFGTTSGIRAPFSSWSPFWRGPRRCCLRHLSPHLTGGEWGDPWP